MYDLRFEDLLIYLEIELLIVIAWPILKLDFVSLLDASCSYSSHHRVYVWETGSGRAWLIIKGGNNNMIKISIVARLNVVLWSTWWRYGQAIKKTWPGVKTAPAALQIRRRIFSPGRENPRTPTPTLTRWLSIAQVRIGPVPPPALVMGMDEGIFFNLSLKFAPTGNRTQDLRSAAKPPNRLD